MKMQSSTLQILPATDGYTTVGVLVFSKNSQTGTVSPQPTQSPGLLSDAWFDLLSFIIAQATFPAILIFGIATNTLNLVVFLRIGLKDSVTSSFFALTLTDFLYLWCSSFTWLCYTLYKFDVTSSVRLDHLALLGTMYYRTILAASILITTYIAVQRCCCVAVPLKFKGFFTLRKNTVIIILVCIVSVVMYAPRLSAWGLKKYWHAASNSSWYGLWLAKDWDTITFANDVLASVMLPIVAQVITVFCMFILIANLRKSSTFRRKATSSSTTESELEETSKINDKEVRVVKAVTCVTLMFILSNVLPICIALTREIVQDFDLYQRYHNLFYLMNCINDLFQALNASLNIFVYISFNSTYRNILLILIRLRGSLGKTMEK